MAALFNFEVHTPYRFFYNGKVQSVTLQLLDGEICVYAKHSAFIAPVVTGILRFKYADGKSRTAFISDGIFQVKEYKYVLMVDTAEWPEEIDYQQAIAEKEKAEETIEEGTFKFETEAALAALCRAKMRVRAWEEGQTQTHA